MGFSRVSIRILFFLVPCFFFDLNAQIGDMLPVKSQRIYVPVGNPDLKKVLMAVERPSGNRKLARDFYKNLLGAMAFTDFFELLPEKQLPSRSSNAIGADFNRYRALGVAFLIRTKIDYEGDKVVAEVRLFDVPKGVQILGRKYPFLSRSKAAARELANFSGDEIIKVLTGEAGIFRTRLLMSCGKKAKEIYVMDYDGQNVQQISTDRRLALSPSWAPDGKRIAFTSYTKASKDSFVNPNIYIYDLQKGRRKLVTAAKGVNSGAAFHPRKDLLAYTFSNKGRPEIFILDLIRKTRMPVTKTHFFSIEPDWSPDGLRLAYSSLKSGRPHIYVSDAQGGNARKLTNAGVYNSSPRWSPKGDRLVFTGQENRKNNFNIFLIDPMGSNLQRLTDGKHSSENPSFSPDGRYLAFASNESGQYRVHVMALHSGRVSTAISPKRLGSCKQPSWSPRL